jgi:hypothetical protein
MIEMNSLMGKNITTSVLGTLLFAAALSIVSSPYIQQSASAQVSTVPGTSTSGTFNAKGYMGILVLTPSTLQAMGGARPELQGSIIGGNWSFNVAKGVLQDFKIDLNRVSLAGKNTGTISISQLANVTGATTPSPTNAILLRNNSTTFQGTANISVNGTVQWKNVPVIVDLINGRLLNVSLDNAKTGNQFLNAPLFGLTTSLVRKGL